MIHISREAVRRKQCHDLNRMREEVDEEDI